MVIQAAKGLRDSVGDDEITQEFVAAGRHCLPSPKGGGAVGRDQGLELPPKKREPWWVCPGGAGATEVLPEVERQWGTYPGLFFPSLPSVSSTWETQPAAVSPTAV